MPLNDPIEFNHSLDLQDAIDMAIEKNTIISFLCPLSNNEIRGADVDWKGCTAYRGFRESKTVSVCLESIQDEIFE